ncbi:cupin domain-containing protein [Novosphingobium sp.]|uniref:cupin domain-containing protein n=1 Tax=Novosphingobium sp. TaxID=1874826 RepID=UPI000BD45E9F|nr:cupin domain-containing protein [Novosphingobium sp.]OYW50421.1 MAG: cupin [Novosphingobium sp. 12-62-10]OZA31441.1 MAG: cupin [Novosphingobium sp. 17-62-9]HQS70546.1 cupin domain-containing protein [Novosphingobium sp.]
MTFDPHVFLRDCWQKRPLLIRGLFPALANPLEPDELAGLACEEGVEARIIRHAGAELVTEHGPFAEDRFGTLGPEPWTLLVNAVDHHVPDVSALIDTFRFIPNWRIDDVMVSYATDHGGVGPHFDQYDVFLIQGLGRRLWQVGEVCDETTALLPNPDLRLLANFKPVQEWVLEPGDVLYVPPGIAHNGVAVGDDCMTYSVGFRAPSQDELLAGWAEHLVDESASDRRYADPALALQANPGEISAESIDDLHAMVTEKLLDRQAFARWFGQYSSAPKNPEIDWSPDVAITAAALRKLVSEPASVLRNPASRFSFVRESEGGVTLFVDGRAFACAEESAPFAERLCAPGDLMIDPADLGADATVAVIVALLNMGSVQIG